MLRGKTALITGSTSGIGLGIAEALAAQGANVVLNGFGDPAEVEAIRARIARTAGVKVIYHATDLSQPSGVANLMATVQDEFGGADIVVNNAGIQHVSPVEAFPVEKWDLILALNLTAAFHTTRLALPAMLARKWGRVINIASAHGLVASPFKSAYVAAKHGIVGFTKSVALEVAEKGITVNAICPGYVLTPAGGKTNTGYRQGARHFGRRRQARRVARGTTNQAVRQGGRGGRAGRLPRLRCRRLHHRDGLARGRRLDGAVKPIRIPGGPSGASGIGADRCGFHLISRESRTGGRPELTPSSKHKGD